MTDRASEVLHDFAEASAWLARIAPKVEFCSLRLLEETTERVSVRRGIVQPPFLNISRGAMITVIDSGGSGYAATSDLSFSGLYQAAREAADWAERSRDHAVVDFSRLDRPNVSGSYATPVSIPWDAWGLEQKIERLLEADRVLGDDPRITDRRATLEHRATRSFLVTTDGAKIEQSFSRLIPELVTIATDGTETQQRSLGGRGSCRQGGLEALDDLGFFEAPEHLREEAIALLTAPECPDGTMDLLIGPAQMILQIHESIGHPIELDRILGDERNFAGTSFVSKEDFGTLRYGSDLLNVTFDPTIENEFSSYGYDDEGTPATRVPLIENGILLRGLGGSLSQQRLDVDGVACARACHWNRPPIDRMANLNIEPGADSFGELLRKTRRGIFMDVNSSWSIDDSRRNFQFGCEVGRVIEDGDLKGWVRNPGYRGRSSEFWRSLAAVGDRSTVEVLGTPNCGKGEPNQMIDVGHSSPACLFRGVEVFGGGGSRRGS